ncbi:MAG TPA: DUF1990 domain-containing protein [Acidimicrobiales bacterium]|nr:DUF1990 domain-containing protein [Acidimicrobiales bacterium]
MFVVLGRPSDRRLADILAAVRDTSLTYAEHGRTLARAGLPAGYHHVRARQHLGRGDEVWRAACDGVRTWRLHRGSGLRVAPADPPIAVGTEVVTDIGLLGPVHVVAACRIVEVVDEPDRYGFAYGTLRVHPAQGEEAFVVVRDPDGAVRIEVTAFSRPNGALLRLGGPVVRRQQAAATERYLHALRRHVDAAVE